MRKTLIHRPSGRALSKASGLIWAFLMPLGLVPQAFAADTDEQAIEEVVVTGSYLKRSSENTPSPLSVVSAADIEDLGAQGMAEVISTLPWQSGSETRSATFNGAAGVGQMTVNLRNLGMSSTLVLVNGKRNVATFYDGNSNAAVDIQTLVPTIALERIEIVKDGASALYGSDAIAGAVNFITKKDFEGLDVSFEHSIIEKSSKGDTNNAQMIFGVQGDRGGIVLSAGAMSQGMVTVGDLYNRYGGSTFSSTGQPGTMIRESGSTSTWANAGTLAAGTFEKLFTRSGTGTTADPFTYAAHTGTYAAGDLTPFTRSGEGTKESPYTHANQFPRSADGSQGFGNADPSCEAADGLDAIGGAKNYSNALCAYDFGPFFPLQGRSSIRQMFMTGHYDLNDNVELYFEMGANGGEFFRYNSLNPNAVALDIPINHPGLIEDAANRGINPQTLENKTRMIGRTILQSGTNERPLNTYSQIDRSLDRMQLGAIVKLQDDWQLDVSYTRSVYNQQRTEIQDTQSVEFELAINGFGGPNCDPFNGTAGSGNASYASSDGDFGAGNCYYFNPFGNSYVKPDGSAQDDLSLVNPPELYQYLLGRVTSDRHFEQDVFDAVFTGTILDEIGLAIGMQHRKDFGRELYDATMNSGNLDFVYGATDWKGTLTTTALFTEVAIPLGESVDVNVALRYEDFDEINQDTTDPKITILWRATDTITARASGGSSFRVGSLNQLFGKVTTVHNMTDTDGTSAYKPSLTEGNPDLKPESADMWNIGVSWIPEGTLEGLQVDLDYYDYEYEDILSRESYLSIVEADNAALNASSLSVVDAIAAGVGNREQVLRTGTGKILRVLPNFVNQNSAEISGVDAQASYSFDNQYGAFRAILAAAWVNEFLVAGQKDAVGMYNVKNPVMPRRALPEYKVNASLNWSYENHRAHAAIRYIHGFEATLSEEPATGFWKNTVALSLGSEASARYYDPDVESWTTVDASYTYALPEMGPVSSSSITIGAKNLFDRDAPWVPNNTTYDPVTHDFRGRVWYMRMAASM
jgi:iron complex outermembrane receptor protein